MGTTLHTLAPNPGANRPKKRVGRGHGSGTHKTAGKGTKGQKARTGHHGIPKPGFEGGQTAMARRLPKRGFTNARFKIVMFGVNLGDIGAHFTTAGTAIGLEQLKEAGLVPRSTKLVKVLGTVREGQSVPQKLTISAHAISASAKSALEKGQGVFTSLAKPREAKPKKLSKKAPAAQAAKK
jgi:large subunit ribosomal protein L15